MEILYNFGDISSVASRIIAYGKDVPIWLFDGEMGAGKTTLIKEICRLMGVSDQVVSPTYSLVNEYLCHPHETIYHFDFYRIKNEEEAFDIGTEEYFNSGKYCFVEWPVRIPNLIPQEYISIKIQIISEQHRKVCLSKIQTA